MMMKRRERVIEGSERDLLVRIGSKRTEVGRVSEGSVDFCSLSWTGKDITMESDPRSDEVGKRYKSDSVVM